MGKERSRQLQWGWGLRVRIAMGSRGPRTDVSSSFWHYRSGRTLCHWEMRNVNSCASFIASSSLLLWLSYNVAINSFPVYFIGLHTNSNAMPQVRSFTNLLLGRCEVLEIIMFTPYASFNPLAQISTRTEKLEHSGAFQLNSTSAPPVRPPTVLHSVSSWVRSISNHFLFLNERTN